MADHVILHALDDSPRAGQILDAFEQRTGLRADVQGSDRYYALHDHEHRERIVHALNDVDPGWTDHIGLKLPG
jgi:hypothetical protein